LFPVFLYLFPDLQYLVFQLFSLFNVVIAPGFGVFNDMFFTVSFGFKLGDGFRNLYDRFFDIPDAIIELLQKIQKL
jgi:hypothetical protein